jgi:putative ABC transport system permease protein
MSSPVLAALKSVPVRLRVLWDLYVWRVRQHPVQELMAGVGIAVGVALLFGVLVANTSVTGSTPQLVHQLVGNARFVLASRSSEGFDEGVAEAAGRLPGVQVASPLLKESAVIEGANGHREIVQLLGVTASIVALEGESTRNLGVGSQLVAGGIGLPEGIANAIGARAGRRVTLLTDGSAHSIAVRAVLGTQTIGAVAESPVAVALLPTAQALTGRKGRVTQLLVRPAAGAEQTVLRELRRLAAGRLEVAPADNELRLLENAAKPSNQSISLFAVIGAMVGFLLALNAMLITTPERRRFAAEMRTLGFTRRYILAILAFQAAILGVAGSLAGIGLGYVLSRTLFHQVPGYLAFAFILGAHQSISPIAVLAAVGCGVLAAFIASTPFVMDLRSEVSDAVLREPGEAGQSIAGRTIAVLSLVGVALIAGVTALVLLVPSLTVAGGAILAIAGLCLLPAAFLALIYVLNAVSNNVPGSLLPIIIAELEETTLRSVALAGIAALAVYGSVAVGGAQHDLLRGLDAATVQYLDTADLWVTSDNDIFIADSFPADHTLAAVANAPGVAHVHVYQGDMLNVGSRRLWIRARPGSDPTMIQASQLLKGNIVRATALMRHGGWAVISNGFASERHLAIGQSFTLPTPSGSHAFKVAAITTNVGWAPGAITLNSIDYRRYWQTANPTALEVTLRPGVSLAAGKLSVTKAIAQRGGLQVQTSSERAAFYEAETRQGLRSLSQIATLLLIAAALAVASALSTAIWQRRSYLASLKVQGFDSRQLWRALLVESASILALGCFLGAILGVYGHALADHWLSMSTGFPAPFSLAAIEIIISLALVLGIALLVITLPGLSTARVPATESFQEGT